MEVPKVPPDNGVFEKAPTGPPSGYPQSPLVFVQANSPCMQKDSLLQKRWLRRSPDGQKNEILSEAPGTCRPDAVRGGVHGTVLKKEGLSPFDFKRGAYSHNF